MPAYGANFKLTKASGRLPNYLPLALARLECKAKLVGKAASNSVRPQRSIRHGCSAVMGAPITKLNGRLAKQMR
jgi:hypothetical protein